MTCQICYQTFGNTVSELDQHLADRHPWFNDPKLTGKTPIFVVIYGDGQHRLVAYVGLDEDRAQLEFYEIVESDEYGVYLQKNGKTIAKYTTSAGVGVDQPASVLRQKGRVASPVVTVDPHKNCSYTGRCMANFFDPYVKACR